jgi:hypothetical protein
MFRALKSQIGNSIHSMGRLLQRPLTAAGSAAAASPQRSKADRAQRREAAIRMQIDLIDLLDKHPSTRQLMRHLDAVERALQRGGLSAWERLPVKVHARALLELDSLVQDWSATGLAELRSRTAVLVKNRPAVRAPDIRAPESHYFDASQRADVSEVEHSVFEESQRSWAGGGPLGGGLAPALPG